MADPVKRLNYYDTQFLRAKDFNDEQLYHVSRRRLLTSLLHNWGIVQGLKISYTSGKTAVTISPGVAIDRDGKEMVLIADAPLELREKLPSGAAGSLYVTIQYAESQTDPSTDGGSGQTRWTEQPIVSADSSAPVDSARVLVLGKLTGSKEAGITALDESDRQVAGSVLPDNLQVNALTLKNPAASASSKLTCDNNGQANLTSGLAVTGNTYMGVGTSISGAKLEVSRPAGDWLFLRQERKTEGGGGFHIHNPWGEAGTPGGPPDRNRLEIGYRTSAGQELWTQFTIDGPTGNIGIGAVPSTSAKLFVNGAIQCATDVAVTGAITCDRIIEKSPRPGPTPTTGDLIRKDVPGALGPILTIANAGGGAGAAGAIDFRTYDVSGNPPPLRIESIDDGNFSNHLVFFSKKPGAPTNQLVESMRLTSAGTLGIGTQAPDRTLTIQAAGVGTGVYENVKNDKHELLIGVDVTAIVSAMTNSDLQLRTNNANRVVIQANTGRVGIGNTAPISDLHVRKDAPGKMGPILTLMNGGGGLGASAAIDFDGYDTGANPPAFRVQAIDDGQGSASLAFFSKRPGAQTNPLEERFLIGSSGKLISPMWRATQVMNEIPGPLAKIAPSRFTSGGGTLVIIFSGSGFAAGARIIGMTLKIDGVPRAATRSFTNEPNSHKAFTTNVLVQPAIAAGNHTLTLEALPDTETDFNDWFNVTVLELPF